MSTAKAILDERLARGEITPAQHQELLAALAPTAPPDLPPPAAVPPPIPPPSTPPLLQPRNLRIVLRCALGACFVLTVADFLMGFFDDYLLPAWLRDVNPIIFPDNMAVLGLLVVGILLLAFFANLLSIVLMLCGLRWARWIFLLSLLSALPSSFLFKFCLSAPLTETLTTLCTLSDGIVLALIFFTPALPAPARPAHSWPARP